MRKLFSRMYGVFFLAHTCMFRICVRFLRFFSYAEISRKSADLICICDRFYFQNSLMPTWFLMQTDTFPLDYKTYNYKCTNTFTFFFTQLKTGFVVPWIVVLTCAMIPENGKDIQGVIKYCVLSTFKIFSGLCIHHWFFFFCFFLVSVCECCNSR